jgi:hypothetical protein
MEDHNEKFLDKIMRMKKNLELQVIQINREKDYEQARLLEKLERDSEDVF